MPIFLSALIGGLVRAAASFVGAALIALGISAVTFTGMQSLFTVVKDIAFANMDAASAVSNLGDWFGIMRVGACMNILFSSLTARMALNGLRGGSIKKWVTK